MIELMPVSPASRLYCWPGLDWAHASVTGSPSASETIAGSQSGVPVGATRTRPGGRSIEGAVLPVAVVVPQREVLGYISWMLKAWNMSSDSLTMESG